jgi:ZIP family zinc transporter
VFEALVWGLVAGSSLLMGTAITLVRPASSRVLGAVMAFGAGALLSAVAYELVEEALTTYEGGLALAGGLFAGSMTYFGGDLLIDRAGGGDRMRSDAQHESASANALVLGTVLDGIPESVVLGISLLSGGVSVAMLVGVFISNLPESMASTAGLRRAHSTRWIVLMWAAVVVVSGIASALGYGLLGDAPNGLLAFMLGFAGGAVLTMLADTMMPEAFEHGGPIVGLLTTLGFAVAVFVGVLED